MSVFLKNTSRDQLLQKAYSIRNHTSDGMVWYGILYLNHWNTLAPQHTAGFHGGRVLYKKKKISW